MRHERCPMCRYVYHYDTKDEPSFGSILAPAFVDGRHTMMCPICYAKEFRRIYGVDWQPVGECASEMYALAKRLREAKHGDTAGLGKEKP